LNAANEFAVEAFLNRLISFQEIAQMVEQACDSALADGVAHEPESVAMLSLWTLPCAKDRVLFSTGKLRRVPEA
jgi:1-deoxy-D-xylulose 5-phosphate reductoisomerase